MFEFSINRTAKLALGATLFLASYGIGSAQTQPLSQDSSNIDKSSEEDADTVVETIGSKPTAEPNKAPVTIQYQGGNVVQNGRQVKSLPDGFSGTQSELDGLNETFSLYEPEERWLKPGRAYFRKDMVKPEEKKKTLD